MTDRTSYRLPAEWEPQAGVLIAWPHADTDWADRLAEVETTYVALAAAVTRFEPLHIIVADTWLRDSGPITLTGPDGVLLNDYRFTGWGGKFGAEQDDALISGLLERGVLSGLPHKRIDWALEGGGIESDGRGTILTTRKCLNQRHPEL